MIKSCKRHWNPRPGPTVLLICSAIACLLISATHGTPVPKATTFLSPSLPQPQQPRLKGRFLQMTDLHPDEHYLKDAAVSTSCHTILDDEEDDDAGQQTYLGQLRLNEKKDRAWDAFRSDHMRETTIPTPPSAPINTTIAGWYGAPNTICDSPLTLIDATFDWISKNIVDSVDFVLWTGDNARHDSDNTYPRTQEQINAMNKIVATKFLIAFPSGPSGRRIPVIPSIGNNDIYPHNILQPGPNPIIQYFATIWSEFIPESMAKTFARGGYYAVEAVEDKITVFSLNTLYFYIHNVAVDGCKSEEEPGTEQMDWLEAELDKVRQRRMVAYLTGHIPPEKKSYSPTCHSRYTQIALAYQDVIVGHMFGHANIDHFFLLSHKDKKDGDDESLMDIVKKEVRDKKQNTEYGSSNVLGLASYLEDLWKQYEDIPQRAQLKDYAVAMVSPSVIPTYNPTLRVFSYQLDSNIDGANNPTSIDDIHYYNKNNEQNHEIEEYFGDYLDSRETASQWTDFSTSRRRHRYRRPQPAPTNTFGFPQGFTQYWCNLTAANQNTSSLPMYEIEYQTREDYGLENLGVSEWLALARRIVREKDLKKVYLDRLVVQSGADTTLD
ncbi:Endopolyphosphatase [Linnemannia zychae]|nr:Endopolyphosphatase [Linnemannia zychae]